MPTLEDFGSSSDTGVEGRGGREIGGMAFRSDLCNKVAQTERKRRGWVTGAAMLPFAIHANTPDA